MSAAFSGTGVARSSAGRVTYAFWRSSVQFQQNGAEFQLQRRKQF